MTFFRCPLSLEVRILRSWENWIFLPLQNYGKTSSAVSDCLEKFWFKCATCMIDTVHCCCSGVFIVNFEQISHIGLVFPQLTFNKQMPAGKQITKVNKPMISPKNGKWKIVSQWIGKGKTSPHFQIMAFGAKKKCSFVMMGINSHLKNATPSRILIWLID